MTTKTVLITGALAGIGRATSFEFAKQGFNVVISGRRADAGQALASELAALGGQVLFVKADVSIESEVESLIQTVLAQFGQLDIAINNAGVEGTLGAITSQTESNYRHTFDTNVLGTLLLLKHELNAMQRQGQGSIVNLSSIVGQVGAPGAAVYAASKHAVEGLTKSTALEVAPLGIRVNAVAPGPVDTDMLNRFVGGDEAIKNGFLSSVPAKRAASAEEVAKTIVWLAAFGSTYLTGQSVAIDGGYTAQ